MGDESLQINVTPFGVDLQKFSPDNYSREKDSQEIVICNIKMLKPKYGIKEIILAVDLLVKDQNFIRKCDKKLDLRYSVMGNRRKSLRRW